MYDANFKNYLARNTGINIKILDELFNRVPFKIFDVALELIEKHGVNKEALGRLWGDYIGYAYVDPNKSIVNQEYIEKIGISFIEINKILPLYKLGKAVTLCTSHPEKESVVGHTQRKLGELVSLVFCFPFDIKNYLLANKLK